MASLNTLRTKGGVILSVVIGVALLSFLVGDLFSSGSSILNSRKMRIGEIEGTKINYVDYSELVDRYEVVARAMTNNESLDTEGYDMVRRMAWESMIDKYAYTPGFEKLGLVTSEAEQVDMVNGVYVSPVISSSFVNPQTGVYDPAMLQGFQARAQADPNMQVLWGYMKEQMNNERVMSKYMALVQNSMFVNDLEVEAEVNGAKNVYGARIVGVPYSTVADSTVDVPAAEIAKYYDMHKENFKREAARNIEYVTFDLVPSEKDRQDAAKYIERIAEEFRASDAPMQYAMLNSQEQEDGRYVSAGEIDPAIAAAVFGKPEAMYGPVLKNNTYVVARQGDAKMIPDSIASRAIILTASDKVRADSILTALGRGADFAKLAAQYSLDQQSGLNGGDMGTINPTVMPAEFIDPIVAARVGEPFIVNTSYIYVMEVTRKTAPSMKAQIATIQYAVEPSSTTQTDVYNQVSRFYAGASRSIEDFRRATDEAAASKRVARIVGSDRDVSGLADSRELVRWAFNAKNGNVSNIMQLGGDYVVAALTGSQEAGIAPEKEVADQIKSVLVKRMKGDAIAAAIGGMSVGQVAEKYGEEVVEAADVTFATPYIQGVGREPKLIGAIATGKYAKPVAGDQAVYAYDITGQAANEAAASAGDVKLRAESMGGFRLQDRVAQAMQQGVNIVDNRVKFF